MNKECIKLSFTLYDRTFIYEQNKDNISELVEGFIGLCLAQTYHKESILNVMKKYIENEESD